MSFSILGIGTATPPRRIAQRDAAILAGRLSGSAAARERTLAAIYRQTRIAHRGSVLLEEPGDEPFAQSFFPPAEGSDDGGPTTAARMARYAAEAPRLAAAAGREALARGNVSAAGVTHLVTCSCTGFAAPGVDLAVIEELGLPPTVARCHVGFMGCHGAFNAIRAAAAFAAADPTAVVLTVCVELCSLHFQYGAGADRIVANSIFADGAAAVVGRAASSVSDSGWRLVGQLSEVLPGSADSMGWIIGDHGFEMTLSAEVPGQIASAFPDLVSRLLRQSGIAAESIDHWAIHPGGPRILTAVEQALALAPSQLDRSREILATRGNMSSATILFILERLFADAPSQRTGAGRRHCLAAAFGPGLTAELAVFACDAAAASAA